MKPPRSHYKIRDRYWKRSLWQLEIQADQVLIDERRGHVVAARLNLRYTGILGILVEKKAKAGLPR